MDSSGSRRAKSLSVLCRSLECMARNAESIAMDTVNLFNSVWEVHGLAATLFNSYHAQQRQGKS